MPPPPTLIETRWKALEDRLDSIEAKIDMLIDHLNAPGGRKR